MQDPRNAVGRRFRYWLAHTLKDEREKAGVSIRTIATVLDVHQRTLERVEDPENKGWGDDIDRVIAAYGYMLGIDDSRELWRRALNRWTKAGAAPDFSDELPGSRFLRPIREEAQRQRQARDEPSEKRSARKNRREAG